MRQLSVQLIVFAMVAVMSQSQDAIAQTDTMDAIAKLKQLTATLKSTEATSKACTQAEHDSDEYKILKPHIPSDLGSITSSQLSDPNLATDAEVRAILLTHPKMRKCREPVIALFSTSLPALGALAKEAEDKIESLQQKLIDKKLSWGQYVFQRKTENEEFKRNAQLEIARVFSLPSSAPDSAASRLHFQ